MGSTQAERAETGPHAQGSLSVSHRRIPTQCLRQIGTETAMADDAGDTKSYEERAKHVSVISKPLAGKKLTKKVYKVVKKAAKAKAIKRGVKEVVKGLRKGSKGVCIIAGDISPIDVISHLPVLCEESDVPYIFVPSKVDLGAAGQTKRPTSCTLVCTGGADVDGLDEVLKEVTAAKPVY